MGAELLVNGLTNGAGIAILAVGFYFVFAYARTFHIALGAVYAMVPYLYLELFGRGFSLPISAALAIATGGALSSSCDILNHRRLRRANASPEAHLLSSIGIYIVSVQLIMIVWGPEARLLRLGLEPTFNFFGVGLRPTQALVICSLLAIAVPTSWALHRSRLGLTLRALRDSPTELELIGYRSDPLRTLMFGLAGCLAGIAALLNALEGGFQAHYGFPALILAVVAALSVTTRSRRAVTVVIIAGICLGLLRTGVVWFIGARWQDTASYAIFALSLMLPRKGAVTRLGDLDRS